MTGKAITKEEKMKVLARTMPKWDDLIVDEFSKDPEFARLAVADELENTPKPVKSNIYWPH